MRSTRACSVPPADGSTMPDTGHDFAAERDGRVQAVRDRMAAAGIDMLLVSSPENIYYLTGLDHWGYFAPHVLIVPDDGELVLVTRAMERVTVQNQVTNARFEGHADSETAVDGVLRALPSAAGKTFALENWSSGLPFGLAEGLRGRGGAARWVDATGLIDTLRLVKSPAEQALMREAARVSDAGAMAAIEAIHEGIRERDVAAACESAMIAAGGTYPGFGPFIRSTARLGEEHTTWNDHRVAAGEVAFLELAGCHARYHAPLGRLVHVGKAPEGARAMAAIAAEAFDAVVAAMNPGALFSGVYAAWKSVVDRAGMPDYRRHHCGSAVGIGFPPTWTGGNRVTGLRADSGMVLQSGMTFHVLSWLMGTGKGDFFLSNTVLLGNAGAEVLTQAPSGIIER